jgi:ABC-type thiamine transport system ATPase subunit
VVALNERPRESYVGRRQGLAILRGLVVAAPVLLMDGLFRDPELDGDLRPGPAESASALDLSGLQFLCESAKRRDSL